jgi:glycosyltransferase involved in cell wall biosynthesis
VISFIVPAHDEERYLPATLRSIHEAAKALGEPYEIVVADDASTDGTAALAASLGARVTPAGQRKISAARNAGARAASGDLFLFVDADTAVTAPLVRGAVDALRAGAAGGGAAARFEGRLPWYAGPLGVAFNVFSRLAKLAFGCFIFARRDAFFAAGGFDERLYAAEEWALSRALRKQGRFVILRQTVMTSGRKLRAYSGWEVFKLFAGIALTGPRGLRKRKAKDLWYGPRREDPSA